MVDIITPSLIEETAIRALKSMTTEQRDALRETVRAMHRLEPDLPSQEMALAVALAALMLAGGSDE